MKGLLTATSVAMVIFFFDHLKKKTGLKIFFKIFTDSYIWEPLEMHWLFPRTQILAL